MKQDRTRTSRQTPKDQRVTAGSAPAMLRPLRVVQRDRFPDNEVARAMGMLVFDNQARV